MKKIVQLSLLLLTLIVATGECLVAQKSHISRKESAQGYMSNQFVVTYPTPQNPMNVKNWAQALPIPCVIIDMSDTEQEFLLRYGQHQPNPDICDWLNGHNNAVSSTLRTDGIELNYVAETEQNAALFNGGSTPGYGPTSPLSNCGGNVGNVYTRLATGNGTVRVAVIDSEVKASGHNALFGFPLQNRPINRNTQLIHEQVQYDMPLSALEEGYVEEPTAAYDHATGVAGIISYGMYEEGSIYQLGLISIPILNTYGEGTLFDLVHALDQAAASKADIVNMSFGLDGRNCLMSNTISDKIAAADYIVVASAGNSGAPLNSEDERFPATSQLSNVVTVGSVNCTGTAMSSFSNHSRNFVDLVAPGENISVARPYGGYVKRSGTSFSAPIVTAVLAKLMTKYSKWTALDKLKTATMGVSGLTNYTHYGVINTRCLNYKYHSANCDTFDEPGTVLEEDDKEPGEGDVYGGFFGWWKGGKLNADDGTDAAAPPVAYPNPFGDELTVSLPAATESTVVSLLDFTGREVRRRTLNGPTVTFRVGDLPAGQYFILPRGGQSFRALPVTKR